MKTKTYTGKHLVLKGCDDTTEFDMGLSSTEIEFLEELSLLYDQNWNCICMPTLHIYPSKIGA